MSCPQYCLFQITNWRVKEVLNAFPQNSEHNLSCKIRHNQNLRVSDIVVMYYLCQNNHLPSNAEMQEFVFFLFYF